MFKETKAFSGFSVNDLDAAKKFYGETLGLEVDEDEMGLQIKTSGNNPLFVYLKEDHEPASFTILNFAVDDIDKTIEDLAANGIEMEHYDSISGVDAQQDAKGVLRGKAANMGPDIAWFKDPAGNVLSVLQN